MAKRQYRVKKGHAISIGQGKGPPRRYREGEYVELDPFDGDAAPWALELIPSPSSEEKKA